jgi:transketolase
MGLEDLAALRAVHGSTVLYPSDATSAAALTRGMADLSGIVYLRTTRGAYPVIYAPDESFPIGGSKVVRRSDDDRVLLIGAGVTLHTCLEAADRLAKEGIAARVADLYSVKPMDAETLVSSARATGGRLVVVEDHYPEGGIGEAVMEALSEAGASFKLTHLAVRGLPGSGKPEELMEAAGISVEQVVVATRHLLDK